MGKRGPPREPDAIKISRGTHRRDRHGDPSEKPQPAVVPFGDPPDNLGELGRQVWREYSGKLVDIGMLTEVDRPAFERYCRSHDEVAKCDAVLEKQGEYFVAESGYVGQHPAVNQRFKWLQEIKHFEARFGMSASDRSGLKIETSKKQTGVKTRQRA